METKFNFNSQICTSKAQSERLLALGLKKETADMALVPLMEWDDCASQEYFTGIYTAREKEDAERYGLDYTPAWSMSRLIEMMPTIIKRHNQDWELSINGAGVIYFRRDTVALIEALADNVYHNMINCIEWLIKEGHFNKEYLMS